MLIEAGIRMSTICTHVGHSSTHSPCFTAFAYRRFALSAGCHGPTCASRRLPLLSARRWRAGGKVVPAQNSLLSRKEELFTHKILLIDHWRTSLTGLTTGNSSEPVKLPYLPAFNFRKVRVSLASFLPLPQLYRCLGKGANPGAIHPWP